MRLFCRGAATLTAAVTLGLAAPACAMEV